MEENAAINAFRRNTRGTLFPSQLERDVTVVPNALFKLDLSDGAKLLYAVLLNNSWAARLITPTQQQLASFLNVHPRTIRAYLTELREARLLEVERERGGTRTAKYVLSTI